MPELDILHGWEYNVTQAQEQSIKTFGVPLRGELFKSALLPGFLTDLHAGYLEIWPRTFAMGTKEKPWWISCVVQDLRCGGGDSIGVADPLFAPHPHDLRRCTGKGAVWKPYTESRLETGDVCYVARGKEWAMAAGENLVKVHFGLEGNMVCVRREDYERIIMNDCPGSNKSKAKAEKMRSFTIPDDLTVPYARDKRAPQTIVIMGAIVCDHVAFLFVDFSRMIRFDIYRLDRAWTQADLTPESQFWSIIWDAGHGPDWIHETSAAELKLDKWRREVLTNADFSAEQGLVEVIVSRQDIFNGYGRHTAHDLLFYFGVWPGTPPSIICADDEIFHRFKVLLGTYARQFVEDKYRGACLGTANSRSPFAFNYKSDVNYLNQYVKVYRKWEVNITPAQYNELYMDGLLDPNHTIGEPYNYDESKLLSIDRKFTKLTVLMHNPGTRERWYTVIQAKRPKSWKFALSGPGKIAEDVRHAGMKTTLGPASFYNSKQNQFDPALLSGKRGRPKKVNHSKMT
ncbi:hypothetical protein BD310DRAFT_833714 [Dichomitus squalens]|uniref:Uncharacterized protein n=1 Tax=Dichomitus squalens TaxID=114155 RepID=A0A4Q9PFM2_9APHY|nr:hypothetical protein BD310DRAFT_833714 [Dichomitus squalens]